MAKVTIYSKPMCPYCIRAAGLLRKKGVEFEDISAAYDAEKREEMQRRAPGSRTYPQIFVGDTHVGGCDELMALDRAGKLDAMLADAG